MEKKYYLFIDEERRGPYTPDELLDAGINHETLVWYKGCADWMPAQEIPELESVLADLPPPRSGRDTSVRVRTSYPERYVYGPYQSSRKAYIFGNILLWLAVFMGMVALMMEVGSWRGPSGRTAQTTATLVACAAGGVAMLALLAANIGFLVFLYRCWAVIQDGRTSVSPGAAVGFFFIPLFNHFWGFAAIAGLSRQLNEYAARHRLKAPRASTALGGAVALYFLMSAIPFLGVAYALLNLIVVVPYMTSIFQAVRCFCAENEEQLDAPSTDVEAVPAPAASGLGMPAIFLAFFAFPALLAGTLATPVKWEEYERNLQHLERVQANPPRDRFGPDFAKRSVDRTRNELMFASALLIGGICGCTLAIWLARVARRRQLEFDSACCEPDQGLSQHSPDA